METHAPAAIEELCAAAAAGDLPRLQSALSLLPANPNLNALNRRRLAPLHCAVNAGSEACVRALVCAGADLGAREGDEGKAALSLAVQSGDLRCVTALLELGAVVDVRDNDGWTPLMTAAYFGEEQILAALLAAGADVEAAAACGRLATHLAATASEAGCLAALVRSGASVASRDAGGGTPLHAAAAAGQLPAIRCLLEAGADPGARDGAGRTPAQVAAAAGHATAAEELSKLEPAGQEAAGPAFGSNVHSSAAVSAINAPLPSGAALLGHGVRQAASIVQYLASLRFPASFHFPLPDCRTTCLLCDCDCISGFPRAAASQCPVFCPSQGVVARAAGVGRWLRGGVLRCSWVRPTLTYVPLQRLLPTPAILPRFSACCPPPRTCHSHQLGPPSMWLVSSHAAAAEITPLVHCTLPLSALALVQGSLGRVPGRSGPHAAAAHAPGARMGPAGRGSRAEQHGPAAARLGSSTAAT